MRRDPIIIYGIRAILIAEALRAAILGKMPLVFVALATLVLSMLPQLVVRRFNVQLPVSFIAAITLFVFATLFLGEASGFYERYWWWDLLLHSGSAAGMSILGFLFALFLFEGDRYAAPAWAMALISFSFALTIGALWEIFEFGMDKAFGMNMQKSGLDDTMGDLIVDAISAGIVALVGFFWLKKREFGGLSGLIEEFVRLNRAFFGKFR